VPLKESNGEEKEKDNVAEIHKMTEDEDDSVINHQTNLDH